MDLDLNRRIAAAVEHLASVDFRDNGHRKNNLETVGWNGAMYATLKSKIGQMNSTDYINTKNFIDRLVYDVKNPVS